MKIVKWSCYCRSGKYLSQNLTIVRFGSYSQCISHKVKFNDSFYIRGIHNQIFRLTKCLKGFEKQIMRIYGIDWLVIILINQNPVDLICGGKTAILIGTFSFDSGHDPSHFQHIST